MTIDPSTLEFEITGAEPPADVVIAGFSQFGLAGLTAVDYLVDHLDLTERGRVEVRGLPTITPFADGRPRHHTRLFSRDDLDVTVMAGELFVPADAARPFSDAVRSWVEDEGAEEVAVLSGTPVPHGPDEHRTFCVGTEDYRDHRLADADVPAMDNGFLEGVSGALVGRGMDTDLGVGVLLTPVHQQPPDVEAAVRLVETVADLYDLPVDVGPLGSFADELSRYYADLQERLQAEADRDDRSFPEDRMFM
ncbi:hypothetical protein BRC81_10750 [Halobacteriales archaeon QS_1_68_20]|nr:MAG: hypothetical protein BRC81_10750 [Halobacteriales archaeon QS_1_68_20]